MTTETFWTDERVNTVKQMWADGKSAGAIGAVIETSRSAVLGKINRMGLLRKAHDPQDAVKSDVSETKAVEEMVPEKDDVVPVVEEATVAPEPVAVPETAKVVEIPATKIPTIAIPKSDRVKAEPVRLLDAKQSQCRYPLWEDNTPIEKKMVCGAQVMGEKYSWCMEHKVRVFDPPRERRAKAA